MKADNVITNDTFWKTTDGGYIYSQGGGIFRFPDAQGVEHYYWYGVKYQEAVDYCPKAPQTETFEWHGINQTDYAFGNQFVLEPMDEKGCLVLNVWTKGLNDNKKRPVFVWIHGGGFFAGSGHDLPCYEGRALAEKGDIVTLTLNHRLNVLGYSDLTSLGGKYANSVNLGMQDIVMALQWVKDNIAFFGGDPDNVTIY